MSQGSNWPDFGGGLFSWMQTRFSESTTRYNEVHRFAQQIESSNTALTSQSPVLVGLHKMIVNRYQGIVNLGGLYTPAIEGAKWGVYFCTAPNLNKDVHESGIAWVKSLITTPSVEGLLTFGATTMGTTSKDIERVRNAGKERLTFEFQSLLFSVAAGASISMMFKQVGNRARDEFTKASMKKLRFGWQATGALAILYGFGEIAKTINDSGEFAKHLKIKRDQCVGAQTAEIENLAKDFLKDK